MKRIHHYPAALNRDHARPRHAPAPAIAAVEARLTELVGPATDALAAEYRQRGLRWRVLTLPVMAALVLAVIWRQIPSFSTAVRLLAREPLLWEPPRQVSQQAVRVRWRTLPAELFAALLPQVLPVLQQRAAARTRPLPPVLQQALAHYPRLGALDVTTLEALFRQVGLLRAAPRPPLGGQLLALVDLAPHLPAHLLWQDDPTANEKTFRARVQARLAPGTVLVMDRGFYAFPWFDGLTEHACTCITRQRGGHTVAQVLQTFTHTPPVRDQLVRLGQRKNPCRHPLRRIAVCVGGVWHT